MAGRAPASLKVRALQWLSQREYSRLELRQRLLRLAAAPSATVADAEPDAAADPEALAAAAHTQVDTLLDWLAERGYLSDARFVESRVHARAPRMGQLRIEQELRQHGVWLDPAQREQLRGTEEARAAEVWRRKYGQPAADAAARVRQMRFLLGRGFSPDTASRVVRGAGGGEAAAELDP